MKLILSQYIDAEPVRVANALEHAVDVGLVAAATRIATDSGSVVTESTSEGIRVESGLDLLNGSELRVSGDDRLTVIEVSVPWTVADRDGSKLLAANVFAHTVASEVASAA